MKLEIRYKWKLAVILLLIICILAGMGYLILGKHSPYQPTEETAAEPIETESAISVESNTPLYNQTDGISEEIDESEVTVNVTEQPADLYTDNSLTKYISVNRKINDDYIPENLVVADYHSPEPQELRKEAADALSEMISAAQEDGIELKLISGYRSFTKQKSLYYTYVNQNGYQWASRIDCYPGASEHQLGLAADLGCVNGSCELNGCFAGYSEYQWLKTHSYLYGWIERYPEGKEDITGIMFSPWHYRYLGIDEAKRVYESGLTFEEYYQIVQVKQ